MRQIVRTVLPGPSLLAALRGDATASSSSSPSWRLRPCTNVERQQQEQQPSSSLSFPAAPTLRFADAGLLAGLDLANSSSSSSSFRLEPLAAEEGDGQSSHPARWVTVARSKSQPLADVTQGVLRLWLRNDHPSTAFCAEVCVCLYL